MRTITTLLCLCFMVNTGLTQSPDAENLTVAKAKIKEGKNLYLQAAYTEILELTHDAYQLLIHDSLRYDSLLAEIYYLEGQVWQQKNDYTKAEVLIRKSLVKREQIFGAYSKPVVKSLDVLGSIYYRTNQYKTAASYYLKSWQVLDSIADEQDIAWTGLYNNLGATQLSMFNYQNAVLYFEKAIAANLRIHKAANPDLCFTYINLGVAQEEMADYREAKTSYQKAKDIYHQIAESLNPYYLSHINFCIGSVYQDLNEFGNSIDYYTEALNGLTGDHHWLRAMLNERLGDCYLATNQLTKSEFHYQNSLQFLALLPELNLENYFTTKNGLAKIYSSRQQYDRAVAIHDQSLKAIEFSEQSYRFEALKISPNVVVMGLKDKAHTLLSKYRQQKNKADLLAAHQTGHSAVQLLDSIKISVKESASKQILTDQFYIVYENAIETNYLLYRRSLDSKYLNAAFQLSEKSKNNQLMDVLQKSKAERFAGIPEELLEKERQLKTALTEKKKAKHQLIASGKPNETAALTKLHKELFDLKIRHEKLIRNFEKNYPRYFQLKYASNTSRLTDVQKRWLKDDQSIVEYFAGNEAVYVFVINKDTATFQKLKPTVDFKKEVMQFHNSMRYYLASDSDRDSLNKFYVQSAHRLYQFLIAPIAAHLKENLIIIPDGEFNYIPFAALLKSLPENEEAFKTHDYLLHHYNISYNYSTTLMQEMKSMHDASTTKNLLAVAPSFSSPYRGSRLRADYFSPLEFNEEEVENILRLCKGKALKSSEASKANFMRLANDYKVIHFATHGVANESAGDYSYIAFTQDSDTQGDENILFGVEIYNLQLHADLVVLSACETAVGEFQRGEGLVSTARAFSYAGAKSLITTLWKVSDSKASELMNKFYKALQDQQATDMALRKATQQYLQKNDNHRAHPFYWASFINIGNTQVIDLARPARWKAPLLVVALMVLLIFWYLKRKAD